MDRRTCLIALSGGIALGAFPAGESIALERKVDKEVLREQLTKGLRVTKDEQKNYIDRVVTLVDQGKLAASVVYAMFRWARNRHQRYPFVFFRRGLDTLAARKGMKI